MYIFYRLLKDEKKKDNCFDFLNLEKTQCYFNINNFYDIIEDQNMGIKDKDEFEIAFAFFNEKKGKRDDRKTAARFSCKFNGLRVTKFKNIFEYQFDQKKTRTSFGANFIHSRDGYFVRSTNIKLKKILNLLYSLITIHDAFVCKWLIVFVFIDLINDLIKSEEYVINKFQKESIEYKKKWKKTKDKEFDDFFNFFIIL